VSKNVYGQKFKGQGTHNAQHQVYDVTASAVAAATQFARATDIYNTVDVAPA